jgi:hypothetical protein
MVAFPSIVQHHLAQLVEDIMLIVVLRSSLDKDTILVFELVMGPEGIIKREGLVLLGIGLVDLRGVASL